MKTVKKILDKILGRACVMAVLLVVSVVPSFAADNGCDDENNDAISADLALCSTHAYNIGAVQNPSGSDKDLMKEVIAMKTTVITQQLYKQYEQMESMLRRLKTQLEKAVLTTKLQAAGASTSSSSSSSSGGGSYRSEDKYRVLAGTNNCMQVSGLEAAISCIQSNVRIVMSAVDAGNTTDARKQLEKDLYVAGSWGVISYNCAEPKTTCIITGAKTEYNQNGGTMTDCEKLVKGEEKRNSTISSCANQLNIQIGLFTENRNNKMQQQKK